MLWNIHMKMIKKKKIENRFYLCVCSDTTNSLQPQPNPCRVPGFSVHGIPQASILECIDISFKWSLRLRSRTQVLHLLHWQEDPLPLSRLGSLDFVYHSHNKWIWNQSRMRLLRIIWYIKSRESDIEPWRM